MEDKLVGEVLAAADRAGEVLEMTTRRFPRRDSTKQWNLQKVHGTFKMGTTQQIRHGNGQCWDSEHGERMHQYFFTQIGHQTQRRLRNFTIQVAFRYYENFTIDFRINSSRDSLVDLGKERNIGFAVDD